MENKFRHKRSLLFAWSTQHGTAKRAQSKCANKRCGVGCVWTCVGGRQTESSLRGHEAVAGGRPVEGRRFFAFVGRRNNNDTNNNANANNNNNTAREWNSKLCVVGGGLHQAGECGGCVVACGLDSSRRYCCLARRAVLRPRQKRHQKIS